MHRLDPDMERALRIQQAAREGTQGRQVFDSQWGSSGIVSVGGPPVSLINIAGDDGAYPEGLTLSLSLIWPANIVIPPGGYIGSPTAILEWGSGGWQSRAEVDFANGASFPLAGDSLRVSARADMDVAGMQALVGGFASRGARSSPYSPKRTLYDAAIYAAPLGPTFNVPAFAKTVRVVRHDASGIIPLPGTPSMLIGFAQAVTGAVLNEEWVGSGEICPEIELPPDCAQVAVRFISWAGSQTRAIFGLEL